MARNNTLAHAAAGPRSPPACPPARLPARSPACELSPSWCCPEPEPEPELAKQTDSCICDELPTPRVFQPNLIFPRSRLACRPALHASSTCRHLEIPTSVVIVTQRSLVTPSQKPHASTARSQELSRRPNMGLSVLQEQHDSALWAQVVLICGHES